MALILVWSYTYIWPKLYDMILLSNELYTSPLLYKLVLWQLYTTSPFWKVFVCSIFKVLQEQSGETKGDKGRWLMVGGLEDWV